ncbi:hypothetical protein [Nostoc sp. PCC 7107]|uniref:hypothetical protein n=1 Tax=Nostoc sp. PCC 7107 TaxID=317936 RepID=UPI000302734A|nr:hypothetical protein [Nostoc sp. PCC 7107]
MSLTEFCYCQGLLQNLVAVFYLWCLTIALAKTIRLSNTNSALQHTSDRRIRNSQTTS